MNVRLRYPYLSLAFMANRLRVCWFLNQTQPPRRGVINHARTDGAMLGVNLLLGRSYPTSGDYRHSGMLTMLMPAAKLYPSPGLCDVWLNRREQGNRQCCTVIKPPHNFVEGTLLASCTAIKRATLPVIRRLAGNGKWSGGWPPSGPLNSLTAGRRALVRARPQGVVRSLIPMQRLLRPAGSSSIPGVIHG